MGSTNLKRTPNNCGDYEDPDSVPISPAPKMHLMTHEFFYIPECSVALTVQNLLSKLQAQISFQEDGEVALSFSSQPLKVLALITPWEEKWRLHSVEMPLKGPKMPFEVPGVWMEDNPVS
jgi:hypothetical protein